MPSADFRCTLSSSCDLLTRYFTRYNGSPGINTRLSVREREYTHLILRRWIEELRLCYAMVPIRFAWLDFCISPRTFALPCRSWAASFRPPLPDNLAITLLHPSPQSEWVWDLLIIARVAMMNSPLRTCAVPGTQRLSIKRKKGRHFNI